MDEPKITVPDELFAPAESSSFSGTFALDQLTLGADTYAFEHPLTWTVSVSNTGGSLLVTGMVSGDAVTTCVRCLDPAAYRLEGEIEGYFLIPGSDVELTEEEQEECETLGEDHVIDLSDLLTAALSLELPQTPLCDDDCKGLCAGCGANLNHETCTCESSQEDDEFNRNPFAVLRNITFEE
ncbi:MAG: DUF177 domain-containing protein [Eggerthellaceae bacterium]